MAEATPQLNLLSLDRLAAATGLSSITVEQFLTEHQITPQLIADGRKYYPALEIERINTAAKRSNVKCR